MKALLFAIFMTLSFPLICLEGGESYDKSKHSKIFANFHKIETLIGKIPKIGTFVAISDNLAITSAHFFKEVDENGELSTNLTKSSIRNDFSNRYGVEVQEIIIHPLYNKIIEKLLLSYERRSMSEHVADFFDLDNDLDEVGFDYVSSYTNYSPKGNVSVSYINDYDIDYLRRLKSKFDLCLIKYIKNSNIITNKKKDHALKSGLYPKIPTPGHYIPQHEELLLGGYGYSRSTLQSNDLYHNHIGNLHVGKIMFNSFDEFLLKGDKVYRQTLEEFKNNQIIINMVKKFDVISYIPKAHKSIFKKKKTKIKYDNVSILSGDSGGGLIQEENGNFYLVGISSSYRRYQRATFGFIEGFQETSEREDFNNMILAQRRTPSWIQSSKDNDQFTTFSHIKKNSHIYQQLEEKNFSHHLSEMSLNNSESSDERKLFEINNLENVVRGYTWIHVDTFVDLRLPANFKFIDEHM